MIKSTFKVLEGRLMRRVFLSDEEKAALAVIFATQAQKWQSKLEVHNLLVCDLTKTYGIIHYHDFMRLCCNYPNEYRNWRQIVCGLAIQLDNKGVHLTISHSNFERYIHPYLGKKVGRVVFNDFNGRECYFPMSDLYPSWRPNTLTGQTLLNIEKNYEFYTPQQFEILPEELKQLIVIPNPRPVRRFCFCNIL